jgi:hypothetical protein
MSLEGLYPDPLAHCAYLVVFWGTALAGLLSVCSPQLPMQNLSQPLVGTNAFQVAELSSSLHQLTLSWTSQSVLWCGLQNMESPNLCLFACSNVPQSGSHNDTWIVKPAASGCSCRQQTTRSDTRNPSQDGSATCRAAHHLMDKLLLLLRRRPSTPNLWAASIPR